MPDNLCWFGTLSWDIPLAAGGLGGWFFGERRRHPGKVLRFGPRPFRRRPVGVAM